MYSNDQCFVYDYGFRLEKRAMSLFSNVVLPSGLSPGSISHQTPALSKRKGLTPSPLRNGSCPGKAKLVKPQRTAFPSTTANRSGGHQKTPPPNVYRCFIHFSPNLDETGCPPMREQTDSFHLFLSRGTTLQGKGQPPLPATTWLVSKPEGEDAEHKSARGVWVHFLEFKNG